MRLDNFRRWGCSCGGITSICCFLVLFSVFVSDEVTFPARWWTTSRPQLLLLSARGRSVSMPQRLPKGTAGRRPGRPCVPLHAPGWGCSWPVVSSRNFPGLIEYDRIMVSSQENRHAQHNTYTPGLSRWLGGSTTATPGSVDGPRPVKMHRRRRGSQ